MAASNDNRRRVRKKRTEGKAPRSLAKMTQVLADIYAHPAHPTVNRQDDALAWLGDERHVPAIGCASDSLPSADAKR
jgi:hypothetical protein